MTLAQEPPTRSPTLRARRVVVAPPRPTAGMQRRATYPAPDARSAGPPAAALFAAADSPVSSIQTVLISITTSFLIALLFGAQGLVHAANGMPDGRERAVTLAIGH